MREKLLVISRYVPRYDQNSGDLRFYLILKILAKQYDITCLVPCIEESDQKYVVELNQLAIKVLPDIERTFRETLSRNRFEIAWFEFFFQVKYFLPRIRLLQPHCRIIVDSVDVTYYRAQLKYQVTKENEDLEKANNTKKRELTAYKKVDLVIVVTDEDGTILKKDCPDLRVLTIPNIHVLNVADINLDKNKLIFVGGFTHDPNIDAVVYFCNHVLPIIIEKWPDIQVDIIGSNPTEEVKSLKGPRVNVTGYVPSTSPYLHSSYISIAPLRYGAGMKGKIGEAMAHGRPVVTTSVGAQGMGLRHGYNVLISDTPTGFAECVMELRQNEDLYKKIQKNSIEHIQDNYTEDHVGKLIENLKSELKNIQPKKMSIKEKATFFGDYIKERKQELLGRF